MYGRDLAKSARTTCRTASGAICPSLQCRLNRIGLGGYDVRCRPQARNAERELSLGKIPPYWNRNSALDGLSFFDCRKHSLASHGIQARLIQAVEARAGLDSARDYPSVDRYRHRHDTS